MTVGLTEHCFQKRLIQGNYRQLPNSYKKLCFSECPLYEKTHPVPFPKKIVHLFSILF